MSESTNKTLIIYNSSTGFTEKYAYWLKSALDADIIPFEKFKETDFSPYKILIYGSSLIAGKIKHLKKFAKRAKRFEGEKFVFFTGAMTADDETLGDVLSSNAKKARMDERRFFYCPGGLDYGRMPKMHKKMIDVYISMLKSKKDKSPEEEKLTQLDSISFDDTDRKYIEPIVKAVFAAQTEK